MKLVTRRAAPVTKCIACAALCFLAACVSTGASSGLPQAAPQPTPMEAANRVVVRTTDAPPVAFDRAVAVVQRSFALDTEDRSDGRLVTAWKQIEGRPMRVTVRVEDVPKSFESAEQTQVVFSGEVQGGPGGTREVQHGAAKAVIRGRFGALDALARAYPQGRVLYARQ